MTEDFKIKVKYSENDFRILSDQVMVGILKDYLTTPNITVIYNLLQMMTDRGYAPKYTKDEIIFTHKETDHIIIFVNIICFSVNIECIKFFISKITDIRHHFIIIYTKSITNTAKRIINELYEFDKSLLKVKDKQLVISGEIKLTKPDKHIVFEAFSDKEFKYNPTQHELVPKHTQLSKEESEVFLKKYPYIPIISRTDVISKWYNFKKSRVIEIKQKDGEISYRRVT